jgi:hypothetical protein
MTKVVLSPRERMQLEKFMTSTPFAKEHSRAQAIVWLAGGERGRAGDIVGCSCRTGG